MKLFKEIKYNSDDAWLGISILQCYFPNSELIANNKGIYIKDCTSKIALADKFKLFMSGWDYHDESNIWFWIGEIKDDDKDSSC